MKEDKTFTCNECGREFDEGACPSCGSLDFYSNSEYDAKILADAKRLATPLETVEEIQKAKNEFADKLANDILAEMKKDITTHAQIFDYITASIHSFDAKFGSQWQLRQRQVDKDGWIYCEMPLLPSTGEYEVIDSDNNIFKAIYIDFGEDHGWQVDKHIVAYREIKQPPISK